MIYYGGEVLCRLDMKKHYPCTVILNKFIGTPLSVLTK